MKRIAAILLGMLVLAGIGLLVRGSNDAATGAQDGAPVVAAVEADVEKTDSHAPPAAAPTEPEAQPSAPSTEAAVAPLRERFADLDAAARGGNARAACDLASELDRCAKIAAARRANSTENYVAHLTRTGIDPAELQEQIDTFVARNERLEQASMHCTGIPGDTLRKSSDYIAMAAAAGHVPSQLEILRGHHLHPAAVLRAPALLENYRANAAIYFNNAVEAGELGLLRLVARGILSDTELPIDAYMPAEWREPAFVNALIDLLNEEQRAATFTPGLLPAIGEAPSAEQQQRAKDVYSRHFADSRPPPEHKPTPEMSEEEQLRLALSADHLRCAEAKP